MKKSTTQIGTVMKLLSLLLLSGTTPLSLAKSEKWQPPPFKENYRDEYLPSTTMLGVNLRHFGGNFDGLNKVMKGTKSKSSWRTAVPFIDRVLLNGVLIISHRVVVFHRFGNTTSRQWFFSWLQNKHPLFWHARCQRRFYNHKNGV